MFKGFMLHSRCMHQWLCQLQTKAWKTYFQGFYSRYNKLYLTASCQILQFRSEKVHPGYRQSRLGLLSLFLLVSDSISDYAPRDVCVIYQNRCIILHTSHLRFQPICISVKCNCLFILCWKDWARNKRFCMWLIELSALFTKNQRLWATKENKAATGASMTSSGANTFI